MLNLDHAVIFSRDLDATAPVYRRLGFTLTPRGTHEALGTANHTIMLERTYLELLTATTAAAGSRWAGILERGEGLGALALGARNLRGEHAGLVSRGISVGPPVDFSRTVRLPTGPREARFTVAHLDDAASPAVAGFFCQHHTPEIVWRPEWTRHRNGAAHVAGITICADEPGALAPAYERLLGRAAVHPHPGGVALDLRGTRVWILTPAFAADRLGQAVTARNGPQPIGLSLAVRHLAATREFLAGQEIPFAAFGRRSIAVAATWTGGVHLEFIAA